MKLFRRSYANLDLDPPGRILLQAARDLRLGVASWARVDSGGLAILRLVRREEKEASRRLQSTMSRMPCDSAVTWVR